MTVFTGAVPSMSRVTRARRRAFLSTAVLFSLALLAQGQPAAAACAESAARALQPLACDLPANAALWQQMEDHLASLTAAQADIAAPLAEDQALFLRLFAGLPQAANDPAELPALVTEALQERLFFLKSVQTAPGRDPAGTWANAAGSLTLTADPSGIWQLGLSVAEPVIGAHSCTLQGEGPLQNGLLEMETGTPGESLSLTQIADAPVMGLDFTRNGRPAEGPAACAGSPPINGWYFRVTAAG